MTSGWVDFTDPPSDPFDITRMRGSAEMPIDYDVFSALADPNTGLATTPKASDRAQSAVDGFAGAVTHGLTGVVGTVSDLIASLFGTQQQVITAITTSDGLTLEISDLDGRVTALEGIGVRTQYTTSQTWTNPFPNTRRKIGVNLINAGLNAPGGQAKGGVGGEGGGLFYKEFFTNEIPSSVALTVGASNGAVTSFGSLAQGYNGLGGIIKGAEGTYATSAAPGRGGDAKPNAGDSPTYSPSPGGSSAFAYSPLGADGQSAPTGVVCGGAGGASGAKGSGPFVAGRGYSGGYPGGGGGAYASGASNGDIGYGAAGCIWITVFDEGA